MWLYDIFASKSSPGPIFWREVGQSSDAQRIRVPASTASAVQRPQLLPWRGVGRVGVGAKDRSGTNHISDRSPTIGVQDPRPEPRGCSKSAAQKVLCTPIGWVCGSRAREAVGDGRNLAPAQAFELLSSREPLLCKRRLASPFVTHSSERNTCAYQQLHPPQAPRREHPGGGRERPGALRPLRRARHDRNRRSHDVLERFGAFASVLSQGFYVE